jgi:hypothetical protein
MKSSFLLFIAVIVIYMMLAVHSIATDAAADKNLADKNLAAADTGKIYKTLDEHEICHGHCYVHHQNSDECHERCHHHH